MKPSTLKKLFSLIAISSAIMLSACNGGNGSGIVNPTPPTIITVGGTMESSSTTMANSVPVIYSSTTGSSWSRVTSTTLPTSGDFLGTLYANNQFIAVGGTRDNSSKLVPYFYTSSDGKTWQANTIKGINQNIIFTSVAYGNGTYVVVAADGFKADAPNSYIYTSTDGQNWTQVTGSTSIPSANTFVVDLKYLNNQFVVLGLNLGASTLSDFIYTSSNGKSWSIANLNNNIFASLGLSDSLAYGKNIFAAAAAYNISSSLLAPIYTSTTGSSWNIANINMSPYYLVTPTAITFANGQFAILAYAYSNSGTQNVYITSTDGVNWTTTASDLPATTSINYVKYFNHQFVGTGSITTPGIGNTTAPPVIYTSSNGTTLNNVTPSSIAASNISLFGLAANK